MPRYKVTDRGRNKMVKMKQMALCAGLSLAAATGAAQADTLKCEPGETHIMNVMVSGHPYWVPVYTP